MRKQLIASLLFACGAVCSPVVMNAATEPAAQNQTVTTINGTVLDENEEPCIGVSVFEKGNPSNTASTDAFGHFQLRVKPGAIVVVTYVGYKRVEMAATENLTVYLQPTTANLEQMVVVGYGSQKKANLTGAVATVDVARVMDSRPVQDVTKALQGAVPGLTITNSQGGVGSDATINIRGLGTLSNGQTANPLIVVDGVPVDNLNFIDPEDIAEISVLKDAASSSIYGSRAAFGVILITTKAPSVKDKVSVNYSNNFGWAQATIMPKFAHNVETIEACLQSAYRSGVSGQLKTEVGGMSFEELLPYAQKWWDQHNGKIYTSYREVMPYVDENNVGDYIVRQDGTWLRYAEWDVGKTLFSDAAPQSKHNVSVEGTSGKTQYRLAFGYDAKQNLNRYNPDKMHRYMANVNISTAITDWLKAGTRVSFTQRDFQEPNMARNSYQYLWRWPSFMEFYGWKEDASGNRIGFRNDINNRLDAHIDKYIDRQYRLQAWVNAEIIKGLNLQADFTYDVRTARGDKAWSLSQAYNTWDQKAFTMWQAPTAGQPSTYVGKSFDDNSRWTMNIFATYMKSFGDHNLKIMAGTSAEENKYSYLYARRNGILDYNLINLALTDGGQDGTQLQISSSDTHRATAGFFGRINYDYKGIYLFEANGRYDGSSRFPAKDQWAFFPSFSAGYRFSEEGYWKNLKSVVSNGKLRASYGHLGNEAIGSNMFISTISKPSKINWLGASGSTIYAAGMPTLVSSSLTWERIITTDIGVDLGFLNNQLNLTFDWYSRDTKDMLAPGSALPQVLGASAPYQNAGKLRTNGWELSLTWNHSFGDAEVFATFAMGDATTTVKKWDNLAGTLYSYVPGNNSNRYYEGQRFGDIWGLVFDRFFTEDDFQGKDANGNWILKEGIADQSKLQQGSFRFGPGDVKFKDLNGDGVINGGDENMVGPDGKKIGVGTKQNHGDFRVIGNALPRYEYSFRLGGAWKGFDLDIFFQGVGKRKMWTTNSQTMPFAQTTGALYSYQTNCNRYIFDDNHKIIGYEINQNNLYPGYFAGCFSYSTPYRQMAWQGVNNFYVSNRYITNMAYLRLKNVTLGYTLPFEITRKAYIQKARVYVSIENPFFLYNGADKFQMDPEIATSDAGTYSSLGTGSFGRTNNMMRVYSFGMQVTF